MTKKMVENIDVEAFEREALPHMDSLFRTATKLTGNQKDAEDLVQEVYLRAFKSFNQFTPGTNSKAWLFKIMTNLNINRYQKQIKSSSNVSYDEVGEFYLYDKIHENSKYSRDSAVEDEVINSLLDEEIKDAIERLSYDFRMVVILADIEGFQYQEIADILGIPIGTVRSRLSRGRRLLEKYLWDYAKQRDYFRGECKVVDCSAAVENLVHYIHGEMESAEAEELKEHLHQCKACCGKLEFEEKLSHAIRERSVRCRCSEKLQKTIKSILKDFV